MGFNIVLLFSFCYLSSVCPLYLDYPLWIEIFCGRFRTTVDVSHSGMRIIPESLLQTSHPEIRDSARVSAISPEALIAICSSR
ncbi:hypothetical protein BDQ94DRAFT_144811 [Aspergillus welwitschiae]|uniref:Secreted protein n=1 Tax=Aspergillus welwitschiae TaxID=1341132 RepID=A0A3F3Q0C1_9EURO|nr:hypothetical protein BDQ94DRAFT_144811 [Aspergillus welwitschiae]RDH32683.1 hypothetical protein BDQ94DRAFT_144811 [Aspergillus welwitschiae]